MASSQPPPASLAPPPPSVSFLLAMLGADSVQAFAGRLAPLDLHPRQFGLLRQLAAAEGRSQQALAEALHIPKSRMVALIDDLESRGLVERRPNPTDRRARALYLTAKGRKLLGRAIELATEHEQALTADLSATERDQLMTLLRRLPMTRGRPPWVHPRN
ncbi:MAG: transcriptional regulator-like protein [Solirubrobacterales bacterium]|jgi:DNA-binding MarR family transcriptional regulator|nr:transcriptional regulator-like protein [Solirubrobacterales bacterium]